MVNVRPFLADTEELATADPTPTANDPFVARMTRVIDDLAIQSCNVEEAIAMLCQAAGLHYEIAATSVTTSLPRVLGRPRLPGYGTVSHCLRVWASLEHAADVASSPDKREMGLGRLTTGNQSHWRAGKYKTHNVSTGTLWYTHPIYGGGLSAASVADWVPRRRPFRETIGRKNPVTTDTAPIVRIHFGVKVVKTLNDGLWVSVQGRTYLIEGTRYTLAATEFECSDNSTCRLWCDMAEVVQESTTEWPSYEHVKLATVTTSGGKIVSYASFNAGTDQVTFDLAL